ncbi:MlaA family lipoprotein [Photobacterium angustum]|uniref:MlaA family lipoprotein n=1 Tax=Photobacterium angustum TaxID=661 RepID=UPI0005EAC875|nr:MlaA family lipoprotein [Photobacterium angustum]PSV96341.1 ABC transporter [Photobacterium angustum]PSW80548.1 ABC transporter [Photobacterium angustum]
MNRILLLIIWLSLGLVGCAQTPDEPSKQITSNNIIDHIDVDSDSNGVYDPLEGFNRAMWDLNYNYLDPYIARPVSLAYVDYTPTPVRKGIMNFLSNLDEPASMVNSLLSLNGKAAVTHFNRFWINTVFGLGGLIDIASAADINKPESRRFDDTLGYYGVPNGPYIMIPGYGPATMRGFTDTVDTYYPMLSFLNIWQGVGKWLFEGMEDRAALVKQEAMLDNSPDPYVFTRDAYIQHKDFIASDGKVDQEQQADSFDDSYLDEIDDQ